MPARTYCTSLRLARLIFRLHGLQWRTIHALNVKRPKKVLEMLVFKLFCLRKFNFNLKLYLFVGILSPSKIVNMLQAIFFLWPPVSDIKDWTNWFSFVCFSFSCAVFSKKIKTIQDTFYNFINLVCKNYPICILSFQVIRLLGKGGITFFVYNQLYSSQSDMSSLSKFCDFKENLKLEEMARNTTLVCP